MLTLKTTLMSIDRKIFTFNNIIRIYISLSYHESRQIGSGQTGDGKSECQHSRNQLTKMDWNG